MVGGITYHFGEFFMSIDLFSYGDDETVTNTEVQEAMAYYTGTDGTVDWDSMYNDWLSGEGAYDSAILGYAWMSVNGTPNFVYAMDATFLEENPGTTDEGTLEALTYYAQTTGSTTAVDNYLAFVESSGLADTSDLGGEIEDFLGQFEDDDTVDVDEDDDGDGVTSGSMFDEDFFKEIAPSLISIGFGGLAITLLGGIIIKQAADELADTGLEVLQEFSGQHEDYIDELLDIPPEDLDAQVRITEVNSKISAVTTAMTTLTSLIQDILELPNIVVQSGHSTQQSALDTMSFVARS